MENNCFCLNLCFSKHSRRGRGRAVLNVLEESVKKNYVKSQRSIKKIYRDKLR